MVDLSSAIEEREERVYCQLTLWIREWNCRFVHMQIQSQASSRCGRWRRAICIQMYLRVSCKLMPRGCSSFSPHPQKAPSLTKKKWEGEIEEISYWQLKCFAVGGTGWSFFTHMTISRWFKFRRKCENTSVTFKFSCCIRPFARNSLPPALLFICSTLSVLSLVTFLFWLETPGSRRKHYLHWGRSIWNEKEGWNAPQLTWDACSRNTYSWAKWPEVLLWLTERNRHHGAIHLTPIWAVEAGQTHYHLKGLHVCIPFCFKREVKGTRYFHIECLPLMG